MQLAASDPAVLQDPNLNNELYGSATPPAVSTNFQAATTPSAQENAALQDFQTNALQGLAELMQLASTDPAVLQDPNLAAELVSYPAGSQPGMPAGTSTTTPTESTTPTSTGSTTPTDSTNSNRH